MQYTPLIQKAIRFATKVHETDQKQKRKGKDIPYITHPLSVGLILARASASEQVVAAGILHDTLEDSTEAYKVTQEALSEAFGAEVAQLVESVTETRKELPWEERKKEALAHIQDFSHDSVLLKSADTISNMAELLEDYRREGAETFSRFNAPGDKILGHYLAAINALLYRWPQSPLAPDLTHLAVQLQGLEYNGDMTGKPVTFAQKLQDHNQFLKDGENKLRLVLGKIKEAEDKGDTATVEQLVSEAEVISNHIDEISKVFEIKHGQDLKTLQEALKTRAASRPDLYLDEDQQKVRRIALVHCEDESCGFGVEFKHPNCTFYFCKEHGAGFNVDLATVSAAGVECELHGKMERYDLVREDNVCPRCEKSTLAVLSVGR